MDVASDACILINFAIVDRLDVLGKIAGYRFHVTKEVLDEIEDCEHRERIEQAIRDSVLQLTALTGADELAIFVRQRELLGKGESSCLALVQHRRWMLCTVETKGAKWLQVTTAEKGHVLNTPGILLLAIKAGILSVEEADGIKASLETRRFKMSFKSFSELI
jgi:predicted nucleic acid-binding protein